MRKPTKLETLAEAYERMQILLNKGYSSEAVDAFISNGVVCISDSQPIAYNGDTGLAGIVYRPSEMERYEPAAVEALRRFEDDGHGFAYAALFDRTSFGRLISVLYVSDYPEEWECDKKDLKDGVPFAYVANVDNPDICEMGSIVLSCFQGALFRS